MAQLPHTFPFPSRRWMLANMFLYVTFAILVPLEAGAELLYKHLTDVTGIALWLAAVVNGALALVWLRYFERLEKRLSA